MEPAAPDYHFLDTSVYSANWNMWSTYLYWNSFETRKLQWSKALHGTNLGLEHESMTYNEQRREGKREKGKGEGKGKREKVREGVKEEGRGKKEEGRTEWKMERGWGRGIWRSLVGCSPWGHWGSDTSERLHFHFSLSCIGEGNGNPLQCSCLENPRDGEAWWPAVYGVAQSRTWLKQLSSSK